MKIRIFTIALAATVFSVGCAQKISRYHTVYELDDCKKDASRSEIRTELLKAGFYRKTENLNPYEIYKKPQISKKGILSADPFEDVSGEFGLVYCKDERKTWIGLEELKSCSGQKDCTISDQKQIGQILGSFQCQIQQKSFKSIEWKLNTRQDWTVNTCKDIINSLN